MKEILIDILIALLSFTIGTFIFLYYNDTKLMEAIGHLCVFIAALFILKPIFQRN